MTLTEQGEKLKDDALEIPMKVVQCVKLQPEKAKLLYQLLYKVLNGMNE
nr:hypothetical protein [uncultured Aminipila sp.]